MPLSSRGAGVAASGVVFFTEISEATYHKVHHHLLLASNIERLSFFFNFSKASSFSTSNL